ncbi:MAG: recombination mediator RecR [Gammaproteobacteria bacterium]|nr:recombination protein RecR [Chromatiales bacterium]MDP6674045.1 recombination mediator RecR [Gammaproteobacteria bacterium]
MHFTPRLQQLLASLRCLPGVGPKSAQRMAFHLLDRDRDRADELAQALQSALAEVGHCQSCRMFAEQTLCPICADKKRDSSILCVVETPADVIAVDESGSFRGRYFVLMGRLSPLDGIGPEELGIDLLDSRLAEEQIEELILATSATVEGEATAAYIAGLATKYDIRATRIAHGVPMGGELEYVDSGTLMLAISARTHIKAD